MEGSGALDWLRERTDRMIGLAALIVCLSVVATLPLVQLLALGYLLVAGVRVVERGELRADLDPPVAARFVMTLINGLQVSGKGGMTRDEADAQVAFALATLR